LSMPPRLFFSFSHPAALRHLHSFPTRRSSELSPLNCARSPLRKSWLLRKKPAIPSTRTPMKKPPWPTPSSHDVWHTVTCWKKGRSEEHTSELQSRFDLVCRLLLEKKNI